MSKLTLKQQRFADEYIITGNKYQSAINAGYSENYAKGNVVKLFENESVKKYIEERLEKLKKESIAEQDEVLQYLTSVMRGKETEQILRGMGEGYQQIVDIEVGATQRIRAAELLGKRYAMWTDKQDINGAINVTIVDDIDDE